MKRPSGFDGGGDAPEPDEVNREADRALDDASAEHSAPAFGARGAADESPGTGAASAGSLLGRRIAALGRGATGQRDSERTADRGAGAGAEPAAGQEQSFFSAAGDAEAPEPSAPPAHSESHAPAEPHVPAEAETVDLSGVREAHEIERLENGNRPGPLARLRAERAADPVKAAERRLREAGRARRARFKRERRRFSAEARRRRRNWLIAGGAVLALAAFVAVGVFTPLMAVREVRVEGASSVNAEEVQGALAGFTGTPLALVDDGAVHQALEPFPMIQRYAVERIPPSTLVVRLEERIPVLAFKEGEGFTLVDAAGVVLAQSAEAPAGVPVGDGVLANTESVAFRTAARALRDMPDELRAQMVSATASSGQDVTFKMASGIDVIWGDAEESRYKALVLQTTLGSLSSQEIPVSRIDVSSPGAPVFQ